MKYDVLVIDPPWQKKKGGIRKVRPNQTTKLDYETLETSVCFMLLDQTIFNLAKQTHTVFLWTIDEFLIEAEQQMLQRGYKRHARFVWDKGNGVAPAFSVRYTHEYCVWYYKPTFTNVVDETKGKYTTVFSESSREHSRKPDVFYKMIDKMFPTAKKLDVFSREKRSGWDQWGDQINYFESTYRHEI